MGDLKKPGVPDFTAFPRAPLWLKACPAPQSLCCFGFKMDTVQHLDCPGLEERGSTLCESCYQAPWHKWALVIVMDGPTSAVVWGTQAPGAH